jgi:membrane associated rhomboid family serine protease
VQELIARLSRHPVVTYALTVVMVSAGVLTVLSDGGEGSEAQQALDAARTFYEQNAEVSVSERNRQLLGPTFVDVVSTAYEKEKDRGAGPVFSARMQDRTQARFEKLADAAFSARMREFAAWRHGVGGAGTPPSNHLVHVFVHESLGALAVSVLFLVVAGISLETAWGSAIFAGFCLLGTLVPALAFRFVDADGGVPLAGASGLVAALLGAYLVRGFGGRLPVPGWALLPVWAFVEIFFVRRIWIENYDSAPWAALGAGVTAGVGVALALRVFGVEARLAERAGLRAEDPRHPALGVAERALTLGNVDVAWTALSEAHHEAPRDEAVALAFWELACDQDRIDEAAGAIGPILTDRLRRGLGGEAVGYWRTLLEAGCAIDLPPAALVKLGEGLLDEGHPEIALDTLGRALDRPDRKLPTALAQRIVRVARDLDPGLTHRAAAIALEDPELDPAARESLAELVDEVRAAVPAEPPAAPAPAPAAPAPSLSEPTRYPIDSDIDVDHLDELTDPAEFEAMNAGGPVPSVEAEDLDPNALSISSLERELSGDLGLDDGEELTDPDSWNDPSLRADLGASLAEPAAPNVPDQPGPAVAYAENAHLDAGALTPDALSETPVDPLTGGIGSGSDTAPLPLLGSTPGPLGTGGAHARLGKPAPPRAGSSTSAADLPPLAPLGTTPLVALEDDLLGGPTADASPLGEPGPAGSPPPPTGQDVAASPVPPAAPGAAAPEAPAAPAPPPPMPQASGPAAVAPAPAASPFGDDALDTDPGSDLDIGPPPMRRLKLVVGVPIGAKAQALEVEVEGRGVSRVPFDRIDAVAVAAVAGLSEKPVLIIDLVLNWLDSPDAPLKVVRFHSNRFDPTSVVPKATSAVDALKRLVAGILKRSGGTPLPDAGAVAGSPFARYADAATYEREVLGAES